MKRWGFDATTYPYRKKLISCKWVKKPPTAPLIYICCCVQYFMFKQYRRKQIAELRPVTDADIRAFEQDKYPHSMRDTEFRVSISDADKANGSPKIGDMIARNPKNHNDQWLVAKQYFEDNFEPV